MKYLVLFITVAIFTSCKQEEAKIQVKNNVHNVKLESISWGNIDFGTLLTGESSSKQNIKDHKESFPFKHQIEFYMVGGGNTVYLRTKESFELNPDDDILIIIDDNTEVVNPSL